MKHIKHILLVLTLVFTSGGAFGEVVEAKDLVEREGLRYKKFSNLPFSGEFSGNFFVDGSYIKGQYINGVREGVWEYYFNSGKSVGQLSKAGNFKNGNQVGLWKGYFLGQLATISNFKDGKRHGQYKVYHVLIKRDHKPEDRSFQVKYGGNYINGKQNGLWEFFNVDGSLKGTKIYRNGVLIKENGVLISD